MEDPLPFKTNCMYYADAGYVCTMSYVQDSIHIRPFQEANEDLKMQTALELTREWGEKLNITNPIEMQLYIARNWSSTDVLYVMSNMGAFVGCIAVDRKNFYPFIGNVFVTHKFRSQGNGKVLMEFAEKYIFTQLKFEYARLWCDDSMLPYYTKQGYVFEHKTEDDQKINVLVKALVVS